MRSEAEFDSFATAYVGYTLNAQDFTQGQVLLVDDGDVNNCDAHLAFNTKISAQELTDNTVKVTLGYTEKPTQTNCLPSSSHPFYFYFVNTRKLLVLDDKLE